MSERISEQIKEEIPGTVEKEIVEFAEGEVFEFEEEAPRAGLLSLLTLAGVGVVLGVSVLLFYYYDWYRGMREDQVVNTDPTETIQYRAEEDKKLAEYSYANAEKTVVRIPIEQALKQVAQDAREGKYRQGVVQKAAAAPATAAPAASAAPPATAPAAEKK
jgi:hypothetical protein